MDRADVDAELIQNNTPATKPAHIDDTDNNSLMTPNDTAKRRAASVRRF
jgi:hypothetical protein